MISSSPPENNIVYFDNAATSFPKPQRVVQGVADFMMLSGGNPGRSGHRLAVEAGEVVFNAREKLAAFFGVKNPMRVIMLFNATDAINAAIQGILWNGGHAVTTSMEHNSVARPLKELEKRNVISLTVVKASNEGIIKPEDIAVAIKPETKLVAVNHGSNVFGVVQPIAEIGAICRQKKVAFLIDASQTAGVVPIDMENNAVDFCAFTGHKGLYGPTGTGGLVISDHFDYTIMRPLRFGGTGSFSDKTFQPEFLPDMFESGTLNVAGIAGLIEGMHFIEECGGLQKIYNHKKTMVRHFYQHAVEKIKNIIFYHDPELSDTGVISFNIEGMEPSLVAQKLSDEYGIMARAGLHCAPLAHETLGTFPDGTVRFSFSIFNTKDEVDFAITALSAIAEG
jgi:cysteine desulfurase family protein